MGQIVVAFSEYLNFTYIKVTLRSDTYISRFIFSWKSDQVKSLVNYIKVRVYISLLFTRISIFFAKRCYFI